MNVVSLRTLPRETEHSVSCRASQLTGYSSIKNIFSVLSVDSSLLIFIHVHQAPVFQRLDDAIHRINHYPADSVVCFGNTYPRDSDLSGG